MTTNPTVQHKETHPEYTKKRLFIAFLLILFIVALITIIWILPVIRVIRRAIRRRVCKAKKYDTDECPICLQGINNEV